MSFVQQALISKVERLRKEAQGLEINVFAAERDNRVDAWAQLSSLLRENELKELNKSDWIRLTQHEAVKALTFVFTSFIWNSSKKRMSNERSEYFIGEMLKQFGADKEFYTTLHDVPAIIKEKGGIGQTSGISVGDHYWEACIGIADDKKIAVFYLWEDD